MFEKTLHGFNFVAVVGSVVSDVAFFGGLGSAVAATTSALELAKSKEDRRLAKEMTEARNAAFRDRHFSDGRTKDLLQMMGQYVPNELDFAKGRYEAALIAKRMRSHAEDQTTDPAHTRALDDFETVWTETLRPLDALVRNDRNLAQAKVLLDQGEKSGQSDRLRDEGITEKAILRLAQRIAVETQDVGQAWIELQNAMDIAVRVQEEGRHRSNHGDFVDEVLRRVAELSREGAYKDALDEIEEALSKQKAERVRLMSSGVEIALLDGDAEKAASLLVRKADLEAGGRAAFKDLRNLQSLHHRKGTDQGINLHSEVSVWINRENLARAANWKERGTAGNDLGIAQRNLGERESNNARLEDAVLVYRNALKERTRDRSPADWAATQANLGTVLMSLGERENGTDNLTAAVSALEAALNEMDRKNNPFDWATAQNSLGAALRILGERSGEIERLKSAATAFRAALEEWKIELFPRDWVRANLNLGNALVSLGEREKGTGPLEAGIDAYRAALEELDRDELPLVWGAAQNNLGNALRVLGERVAGTEALSAAVLALRAALEERTQKRVPFEWAMTQSNLGTALHRLSEREEGTELLKGAIEAYRAALREWTHEKMPIQWARTNVNLGFSLNALGERENSVEDLKASVAAYTAALVELTRDRVPLQWATTQNNLGNALKSLGERAKDPFYLDQATEAFQSALEIQSRDRSPLQWAMAQANLGKVQISFFRFDRDLARLDVAEDYLQKAKRVFEAGGATRYVQLTVQLLEETKTLR